MYISFSVKRKKPWFAQDIAGVGRRRKQDTGRGFPAILRRRGDERNQVNEVITWVCTKIIAEKTGLPAELKQQLVAVNSENSSLVSVEPADSLLATNKRRFDRVHNIMEERLRLIAEYRAYVERQAVEELWSIIGELSADEEEIIGAAKMVCSSTRI